MIYSVITRIFLFSAIHSYATLVGDILGCILPCKSGTIMTSAINILLESALQVTVG